MKTKQNILNGNTKGNLFSFLFIFLFLFSIGFISSSWNNVGGDYSAIRNSQFSSLYGNFESGINETIKTDYYQTFANDYHSELLVSTFNSEGVLFVQNGDYLELYDKDLNLLSENYYPISPYGMHSIHDLNTDGNKNFIRLHKAGDNYTLRISEIDESFNLVELDTYEFQDNDSHTYGLRCFAQKCYNFLSQETNATHYLHNLQVWEYDGNNITLDTYSFGISESEIQTLPSIFDVNSDNKEEIIGNCNEKVYVVNEEGNLLFNETYRDIHGSVTKEIIYSTFYKGNVGEVKYLFIEQYKFSEQHSKIIYLRLFRQNGEEYNTITITSSSYRGGFIGLALGDYSEDGYDDIYISYVYSDFNNNNHYLGFSIYDIDGNELNSINHQLPDSASTTKNERYLSEGLYLARLTPNNYFNPIVTAGLNQLVIFDLDDDNNLTLMDNFTLSQINPSLDSKNKCIPADLRNNLFNEIICNNYGATTQKTIVYTSFSEDIPISDDAPINTNSIPNQNLPFSYSKSLYLNNYFSDYEEIEINILNETLSVELGSLTSDTFNDECINLGLIDLSTEMRIAINTKTTNCSRDIEVIAINYYGQISDNFTITINEDFEIDSFPEEYDNFITDTAQNILNLFPDSDDLSSSQKIMIIVLIMFIVTAILMFSLNTKEGLHTGVLYLVGFVNLMLFIMFIALGYISVGVLIVMSLGLMAIAYFKFKGDN